MDKENFKVDSWLPCFPGFYESWCDLDYDRISEDIKELVEDSELAKICIDEYHYTAESDRVWKNWKEQVVNSFISAVNGILKENNFIESISFQNLYSPKEYNFSTDSVNVQYELSAENIRNIQEFIKEHSENWRKYLKRRYTSRSGFMSYYDNFPESETWIINTDHALSDDHCFGSILNFIIKELDLDDDYFMYYVLENCYIELDIEALQKEVIERTGYVQDPIWEAIKQERELDKIHPKLF